MQNQEHTGNCGVLQANHHHSLFCFTSGVAGSAANCRYDTVAKLGISSGKQHLQTTFPDGIALETAFINPSIVHQLDASAEDALVSASWCDMQALLPPALTHDDATALLQHCSVMQSSGGRPSWQFNHSCTQVSPCPLVCTKHS